jgi:hypothetical protein
MTDNWLTFQRFNDMELANTIGGQLAEAGIQYIIEDNSKFFNPSFVNNTIDAAISLKLQSAEFPKAQLALEAYYKKQVEQVDKDYYLFQFTDAELTEIVSKPDEWGHFDYQLAQKLLAERGKMVIPEEAIQLKAQRIEVLSQPEPVSKAWIYLGYACAILGGLFGIVAGATIAFMKKTLPDGQRVYAYSEQQRKHGKRILVIAIVSLILWLNFRAEVALFFLGLDLFERPMPHLN